MKSFALKAAVAALSIMASTAQANDVDRTYGDIYLSGLARESFAYNPAGQQYVMVCNVNGPDGYLSVRSGPGTNYEARRNLKRLAILTIDTSQRRGHWVRVITADRTHSTDGYALSAPRSLHVSGWAHDGYMCSFLD